MLGSYKWGNENYDPTDSEQPAWFEASATK